MLQPVVAGVKASSMATSPGGNIPTTPPMLRRVRFRSVRVTHLVQGGCGGHSAGAGVGTLIGNEGCGCGLIGGVLVHNPSSFSYAQSKPQLRCCAEEEGSHAWDGEAASLLKQAPPVPNFCWQSAGLWCLESKRLPQVVLEAGRPSTNAADFSDQISTVVHHRVHSSGIMAKRTSG